MTKNRTVYISDLDGTLLTKSIELSSYSREKMTFLLSAGVPITFATARSPASVSQILGDIPIILPVICYNGAVLAEYHSGKPVTIMSFDKNILQNLFSLVAEHDLMPFVSAYDRQAYHIYYQEIINEGMEWQFNSASPGNVSRFCRIDSYDAVLDYNVICVSIIGGEFAVRTLADEVVKSIGDLVSLECYENPYHAGWFWLELYNRKASKSNAIARFAYEHKIPESDIIVFGDNRNDLKMFTHAGHKVAVGNAVEELKASADEVIGTNEEDSVIKYILKKEGYSL